MSLSLLHSPMHIEGSLGYPHPQHVIDRPACIRWGRHLVECLLSHTSLSSGSGLQVVALFPKNSSPIVRSAWVYSSQRKSKGGPCPALPGSTRWSVGWILETDHDVPRRAWLFSSSPRGKCLTESRYITCTNPSLVSADTYSREEGQTAIKAKKKAASSFRASGFEWVDMIKELMWVGRTFLFRQVRVLESSFSGSGGLLKEETRDTQGLGSLSSESEWYSKWVTLWMCSFGGSKTETGRASRVAARKRRYIDRSDL